jgi:DNA-binding CsgD family transcriptional regulator
LDGGDAQRAASLAEEGESLFDASSREVPPWARVVVLHNLGAAVRRLGDAERANAIQETSLHLLQGLGSPPSWTASVLAELANGARDLGDRRRAAALGGESLALVWQAGDRRGVAVVLEGLASTALAHGETEAAARLVAAAARLRASLGAPLPPGNREEVERTLTMIRTSLRPAVFEAASLAGGQMTPEAMVKEGVALAARLAERREVPVARLQTTAGALQTFGLSPREREVLLLLAEGNTNQEIAASLSISHRTVRNHVTNILTKLGVESRTAAATFALRHGLV